jgi:hypothetical protein
MQLGAAPKPVGPTNHRRDMCMRVVHGDQEMGLAARNIKSRAMRAFHRTGGRLYRHACSLCRHAERHLQARCACNRETQII